MNAPAQRRAAERGQILVLFTFCLTVILAFSALLFDGAYAYVQRRKLQDAGDAAALAGANIVQLAGSSHGCSNTSGPPPGSPRADIVTAVLASIDANLPGFNHADLVVTCPSGWDNYAVKVDLRTTNTSFFIGAVTGSPLSVGSSSTALNGQITGSIYSIVLLNPSNTGWPNSRDGCPSALFSGGPTVELDGSMQVNSTCQTGSKWALATNGSAASITLNNNAKIRVVGGYDAGALTITPAPLTGQPVVNDPLAFLEAVPSGSPLTVQSSSKLTLNNQTMYLDPGIYQGGIELRNSSKAFLRPGIYVVDGGGLDVGSQAEFCSISTTANPSNCSGWSANCPDTTCGVLIVNRGTLSGSGAMDDISVAAGATLKLRAYDERALVGEPDPEYRNMLMWQEASPVPSSTYGQPTVAINGGGNVDISGTLYTPSAKVEMGGTSGGSGGNVNLTLQFISWDLEIRGNVRFHFYYNESEFARPTDYGLIQ